MSPFAEEKAAVLVASFTLFPIHFFLSDNFWKSQGIQTINWHTGQLKGTGGAKRNLRDREAKASRFFQTFSIFWRLFRVQSALIDVGLDAPDLISMIFSF